jgi:hypothetical protein
VIGADDDNRGATAGPSLQRAAIGLILASLAAVAARMLTFKLSSQPALIDFLAMWTGGRMANVDPAHIYDAAAIDRAQVWLLGAAAHYRPFPYPPSALLVFGPLARLPFWTAGAVWMGLTASMFAAAALSVIPRRRVLAIALIGLTPGAVWAALSGQCAFLIGALAIASTAMLDRRPWLAGALLGLAAAFKPTVLIMAPIALLAGGHWRSVIAAGIAGCAAIAVSAAAYGTPPWIDWIATAPAYLANITASPRYQTSIVSPTGLAAQIGLTGWAMTAWRAGFAAMGGAVAWRVFQRTGDLAPRLTALFGASLLASPYVMNYETTLLAPGAVMALLAAPDRRAQIFGALAFIALAVAGLPVVSAGALIVFLGLSLWPFALPRPSVA